MPGYTLDEDEGDCVKLDPNCVDQDGWECEECRSGYFYDAY